MKATIRASALVTLLLLLVCNFRPAMAHNEPITGEVFMQPAEPVLNEEAEMRVILYGANSGFPALGAKVTVIADMPVHKMKPVTANLSRGQKRNELVGKLRFTMVGPWEVTLDVLHEGERDQAKFNMEVKIPTTERDEGIARYVLTLNLEPSGFAYYPGLVLIGSVLLMALIVVLAWMYKNFWRGGAPSETSRVANAAREGRQ